MVELGRRKDGNRWKLEDGKWINVREVGRGSRPHREKRPECRPFLEFLGSEKHWIINISDALIKMFL